jgi:hypothetical protein
VIAPAHHDIVQRQALMLDTLATKRFLAQLPDDRAVRKSDALIDVVAARVGGRTLAFDE